MSEKILIIGKGFIGTRLQNAYGCAATASMIHTFSDAQRCIRRFNPKVIVNCIGYTGGQNVDECELDKDATLSANTFVPLLLAEVALRRGIKFVHISSGCIFQYDYSVSKPIMENKVPDYFNLFYSRSKIYTERALLALSRSYNILIPRIRIPLDERPHPKNILTKLIGYRKVIDIPNSVTYLPDFIRALKHLVAIDARGIYNVVNKGGLRYPRLLEVYAQHVRGFRYTIIPYKALRLERTNALLSTKKLAQSGFSVRHINEVLEECVKSYVRFS